MAEIITFPGRDEREWRETEKMLRETYRDAPDGPSIIEECLPKIRVLWSEIFQPFSVSPAYEIPDPVTEQQVTAVRNAVAHGVSLVVERLSKERTAFFGRLVAAEYKEAYRLRHGYSV